MADEARGVLDQLRTGMLDLLYVVITIVFFVIALAYVAACERLGVQRHALGNRLLRVETAAVAAAALVQASCVIGEPDPLSTWPSFGMANVVGELHGETPRHGSAVATVRLKVVR